MSRKTSTAALDLFRPASLRPPNRVPLPPGRRKKGRLTGSWRRTAPVCRRSLPGGPKPLASSALRKVLGPLQKALPQGSVSANRIAMLRFQWFTEVTFGSVPAARLFPADT